MLGTPVTVDILEKISLYPSVLKQHKIVICPQYRSGLDGNLNAALSAWKMPRVSRFKLVGWRSPAPPEYRHENSPLSSTSY
ncbi:hypothetical protein QT970_24235 [Microcoleus sp. herbarium8]|uniref:hypothetical protein n=1 Tax=Microcoleus sp. herbarium8 TaxID=3055436 RepID=UPI002FD63FDB